MFFKIFHLISQKLFGRPEVINKSLNKFLELNSIIFNNTKLMNWTICVITSIRLRCLHAERKRLFEFTTWQKPFWWEKQIEFLVFTRKSRPKCVTSCHVNIINFFPTYNRHVSQILRCRFRPTIKLRLQYVRKEKEPDRLLSCFLMFLLRFRRRPPLEIKF